MHLKEVKQKLEQEQNNPMRNNRSDEDKLMREETKKLYEEIQMIQQQKKALHWRKPRELKCV